MVSWGLAGAPPPMTGKTAAALRRVTITACFNMFIIKC
jgi:hypothetical protein